MLLLRQCASTASAHCRGRKLRRAKEVGEKTEDRSQKSEVGGRRSEVGKRLKAGIGPGRRLPAARKSGETSLMFWVHPTLGADEMRDTCRAVGKVMRRAIV